MRTRYLALPASSSQRHRRAWALRWQLCYFRSHLAVWWISGAHWAAGVAWSPRLAWLENFMFSTWPHVLARALAYRVVLAHRLVCLRASWRHRRQAHQVGSGGGWGGSPREQAEGRASQQPAEECR